jgi:hypothetical protein
MGVKMKPQRQALTMEEIKENISKLHSPENSDSPSGITVRSWG